MSVVVVTTISCNAVILRCSSCKAEVPSTSTAIGGIHRTCGDGSMLLVRSCGAGFSLQRGGLLIRCVAENKDGWRCEDHGGNDYCPEHAYLANSKRVAQPTPQAIGDS